MLDFVASLKMVKVKENFLSEIVKVKENYLSHMKKNSHN